MSKKEFEALSDDDKQYYLHLLKKEVQWRKRRKIYYYGPHEKQEEFHTSPARCRALFGGNRSGKTCAGTLEFLFHITGMYPKWYPDENKMQAPIKGRIVAKDFQKGVGEVIIPSLDEWLDDSLVKKKYRNPIGIPVKWTLKNGSVFDILTYEQNTEQFEGWKGHVAWFDEPPPRDKYVATLRGLVDYKGKHWLTLTPLTQPWIYDDIYTKHNKKDIHVVQVDITDNPYLDKDAIKQFEQSLTPEEKEARLHGRFMHLSGLIYKEFDPNVHICEPFQIKKSWTRYMCIDPHPRMPTACLWLAVDEHDNHWLYDELWLRDMDIQQISNAIHAQEGEFLPLIRLIDPAADKDNQMAGGFNVRKEFMRHGVFCERANNDPNLGKSRIKKVLKPQFDKIANKELPQLRVFSTCKRTIYEFQHYIWEDRRSRKEEYNKKEKPKKKDDHFMDCLRYIYNHGPQYMVPREDDEEIAWEGEYTKHPTRRTVKHSSYYDKVAKRGNHGQF